MYLLFYYFFFRMGINVLILILIGYDICGIIILYLDKERYIIKNINGIKFRLIWVKLVLL